MPLIPVPLRSAAKDFGVILLDGARQSKGQVGLDSLAIAATTAIAITAEAQPVAEPEAVEVAARAISSGDPWAMVVMAVVLVASMVISRAGDWASARKARTEELAAQLEIAKDKLLERERALARAEAKLEVIEEARASGTMPQPGDVL